MGRERAVEGRVRKWEKNYFLTRCLCGPSTHYIGQVGLELTAMLLPQPPGCWGSSSFIFQKKGLFEDRVAVCFIADGKPDGNSRAAQVSKASVSTRTLAVLTPCPARQCGDCAVCC